MKPSDRISAIAPGGSDGWEILYQARALRAAGKTVTDLSIGDHNRRTPDLILDAMFESARGGNTGYSPVPGSKGLREAIAARAEADTGVPTGPGNVVVTSGGQAALFAALMATLDPGETALFIDPYYPTYPGTIRATSAIPVPVPARPEAGFQPLPEDLEAAPEAMALLINTPNNPTGVVYAQETIATICDFVQARDLWLISDEVYDTQLWHGEHLSPRAVPGMEDRCITLGSMSKSHCMTGSRIGWAVGPEALIALIWQLSTSTTYGIPGFIQDAAEHGLRHGQALEREVAETYRARRAAALDALQGANAVRTVPSAGAMYLMLDIRATGLSGAEFAERLLDRHAIAVMPGESFGAAAAGHVRVALTIPREALSQALTTLARFAGEMNHA